VRTSSPSIATSTPGPATVPTRRTSPRPCSFERYPGCAPARHYSVEVGLPEEQAAVPDEIATDGGVHRAGAVLAQLPANYREVLELRFLRGYSVRETARAMNVTVTNAKVLQWRALRRAARLDPEGDE
jgi:DNA-directed RNA polymerase specialized sigma24 family protein